ncbi:MAG TPA: GSCFA domain-containing protein [Caulobacteraceae bacterium]
MPLIVLSGAEAIARTRDPLSRWPRTAEQQAGRLSPLAQPGFSPSFRISKDDLIFTIGSCFARNIEKQLIIEGFNVAASRFEPPADPGVRGDPATLLNRYVVHSIANELRWGLGHGKPFRQEYYLRLREQWFDPHMHPAIRPGACELVQFRREAIGRYMSLAAEARVFVITLGLAEAWYDAENGLYLNGVVPDAIRKRQPDRFQFHVLDYGQVLDQLELVHRLIMGYGRPDAKMLLTVSPVALNTTFRGGDALVANTYSKAVQRAAVDAFIAAHPGVDYFPSYESVMLSDRARVWREDQAHPSDEIVRLNVLRMIEAYAAGPEQRPGAAEAQHDFALRAFDLVSMAKADVERKDIEGARTAFRTARQIAPSEALIALAHGEFLLDLAAFDEARHEFKAAVRLGGARYGAHYQLAKALRGLGRNQEAFESCQKALTFEPTRTGLLYLCADLMGRLGRYEEAVGYAERCVGLEPETERFQQLLSRLREKTERQRRPSIIKSVSWFWQRLLTRRGRRAATSESTR